MGRRGKKLLLREEKSATKPAGGVKGAIEAYGRR